MRRIRILLAMLFLSPLLSGCLVIAATDIAVGTVGAAVGAAGAVGGAAIDVVTPGDDNDDEDED